MAFNSIKEANTKYSYGIGYLIFTFIVSCEGKGVVRITQFWYETTIFGNEMQVDNEAVLCHP